jgi:nitrite reductase/ring-hydroxylating ferredoxin subunit
MRLAGMGCLARALLASRSVMRSETTRSIVRTLLTHHAERRSWTTNSTNIDASVYTDRDHLAREQASLFRRWPQAVALSSDLPRPGSSITRDGLRIPLMLTRTEDGSVHALANVCAHRGAPLSAGRSCRRLTCPYHAWSYDLEGTLVSLPDRRAFPGISVPRPGLRRMPVVEQDGVIWVIPDVGATATPEPRLGAFGDELAGFGIAAMRPWRSRRFDLSFNWKLAIDTFLESYHFGSLHHDTVGPLFLPNLCHAERVGPHVREVLPRRTLPALVVQPPEHWDLVPHSALIYVLFPNTVLVMQLDHIELWCVHPDPVDPGRSWCELSFYVPDVPSTDSSERHWQRCWDLTIDTVIEQDFAMMAGVQRGLASGVLGDLHVGANEPALGLFHAALDDAMASISSERPAAPERAWHREPASTPAEPL